MGLLEPWFQTLRWSSGTWSKASERATLGLDQVGRDSYVDTDFTTVSRRDTHSDPVRV
jgi:hypothetical protein